MEPPPSHPHQNPRWEKQWAAGLKPGDAFDMGCVSPALQQLINQGLLPKGRALVPGCGRGYDVIAFAKAGYQAVGLELSPTSIAAARAHLDAVGGVLSAGGSATYVAGNFFEVDAAQLGGKANVIYDYTFMCAFEPSVRADWARQMASLLAPDGELVTLMWPVRDTPGGPPFSISLQLFRELLEPLGLHAVELRLLPDELCHATREGVSALGRWRWREGIVGDGGALP